MEPALRDGDWVVVFPLRRLPRAGDLVIVRDPIDRARLLAKRVRSVGDGVSWVASDAREHAMHFSEREVPFVDVLGRPALRYWPISRFGRVG